MEPWLTLRPKLELVLNDFRLDPSRKQRTVQVSESVELDLVRASKDHGCTFILGGYSDGDSGGWVMSEVERNLKICIADKEKRSLPTGTSTLNGGSYLSTTSTTELRRRIGSFSRSQSCQTYSTPLTKSSLSIHWIIAMGLRSNCRFNADANTGHAFGIFMASVGALRASRSGAG